VKLSLYQLDTRFRDQYGHLLAGVDEAGRGPWAGPVVSAAVILPPEVQIDGINDSKLLSPEKRSKLFDIIQQQALAWAVGLAGPEVIDRINILQATYQTMRQAVADLRCQPDIVVVDGRLIPRFSARQVAFPRADGLSASVAAASILAKVTRDRLMVEAHKLYPQYGFDQHKGYGTPDHQKALARFGPCEIHRKSFAPIQALFSRKSGILVRCQGEREGAVLASD